MVTWEELGRWQAAPLGPAAEASFTVARMVRDAAEAVSDQGQVKSWVGAAANNAKTSLTKLVAAAEPQVDASRNVATDLESAASTLTAIVAGRESLATYAASWNIEIGHEITYVGPPILASDAQMLADVQNAVNQTAQGVQSLLDEAAALDQSLTDSLMRAHVPYQAMYNDPPRRATPLNPPPGALPTDIKNWTPEQIRDWWSGLTPEQKQELMDQEPKVIGNLDGLPAADRDRANRIQLQRDKAEFSQEYRDRGLGVPESSGTVDDDLNHDGTLEPDEKELASRARNILAADEAMHGQYATRPVLYAYDPAAFHDPVQGYQGKLAVGFGDIDQAKNVSTSLSGFTTQMKNAPQRILAQDRLYKTASASSKGGFSTLFWQGYAAPQSGDVAFDANAERAAPLLQQHMHGLRVINPHARRGVLGHSYGSLVAGKALKGGMSQDVDYAVFLGSPGTGAENVADLGMEGKPVYVGANSRDPAVSLEAFGPDPSREEYGAIRLKAEATDRGETGLTGDHSKYYSYIPGTHKPSESLKSLSMITSGNDAALRKEHMIAQHREWRLRDFGTVAGTPYTYDPENDREPGS